MATALKIRRITNDSDHAQLATAINQQIWDGANDIGEFTAGDISKFVSDDNNILLVAFMGSQVAGLCFGRLFAQRPYKSRPSMYVDELDVAPQYRRQSIGTKLMRQMLKLAAKNGAFELWLGTENDNLPAKKLYESLKPDRIEAGVDYTFKLSELEQ